jgi:hypothetical protein
MRAIQRFMPNARHCETMRIFVGASPAAAWDAARHYSASNIPWVKFLFKLRTFADELKNEKPPFGDTRGGLIDEIEQHKDGFIILEDAPPRHVVVGAIGKFWHLSIPFRNVLPSEFLDFSENGWGKLAWSISVEPYNDGSTICFELRTTATDMSSWKKLNTYYHVIGYFSRLMRHSLMHDLQKQLGNASIPDDNTRNIEGDDIIYETPYCITDNIDIEAPPEIVWRYLMQLGCDRAGWYSIDWLDNGGRKGTDHAVKNWLDRSIGERLPATPAGTSYFEVYRIKRHTHFVIGVQHMEDGLEFRSTWAFELSPIGSDATHLTVRARMSMTPAWKEWLMGRIFYPPVHTIMEMVQLNTIKKYAERDAMTRKEIPLPEAVMI